MPPFLTPLLLLASTAACLVWGRSKGLPTQVAAEAAIILTLGAWLLAVGSSPIPTAVQISHRIDGPWLQAISVTWWLAASRMVVTATSLLRGRSSHSGEARLASDLFSGAIYLTAAFIILNTVLALPIRGLLATSGVIAIVVGLALQSTLADLFSGIAVGIEQSIHVGDLISIDGAIEGVVTQMNWRSIHLSTADADMATVPNSIVAKSRLINRSKPTEMRSVATDLELKHDGPDHRVLELARHTLLLCPTILAEPSPIAVVKAARRRRLVMTISYSVSRTELIAQARGELLQNFRRMTRHDASGTSPDALKRFLAEVPLFEDLSDDQFCRMAEAVETRGLEKGGRLFEAGTTGSSVYIVRRGVLQIVRDEEGSQHILGRIGPGEYIGELSMMTGARRRVSVDALTPASIIELHKDPLEAMLREDAELGRRLEASVRRGMSLLERDVAARASAPAEIDGGIVDRIRRFLGC